MFEAVLMPAPGIDMKTPARGGGFERLFGFFNDGGALCLKCFDVCRQPRDDQFRCRGAGHCDGLRGKEGAGWVYQGGRVFLSAGAHPLECSDAACVGPLRWPGAVDEQVQNQLAQENLPGEYTVRVPGESG